MPGLWFSAFVYYLLDICWEILSSLNFGWFQISHTGSLAGISSKTNQLKISLNSIDVFCNNPKSVSTDIIGRHF